MNWYKLDIHSVMISNITKSEGPGSRNISSFLYSDTVGVLLTWGSMFKEIDDLVPEVLLVELKRIERTVNLCH